MHLQINLTHEINGTFTASTSELPKDYFILNISFSVDTLCLDGVNYPYTSIKYPDRKYQLIHIPDLHHHQTIEIHYHGILDGTTGLCPYVKETTLDDFVLLRYETLFFPIFAGRVEDLDFFQIFEQMQIDLCLHIAPPRTAYSNLELCSYADGIYHFCGYFPNITVGTFECHSIHSGEIAFLQTEDISPEKISEFNKKVFDYMNETYCPADPKKVSIVIIPDGYGSFVAENHLFLTHSSLRNEREFIHELIHLGWNPSLEIIAPQVQRCRFFDEGLTQFLMAEVYEAFYPHTTEETYDIFHKTFCERVNNWGIPICPLTEYGVNDAGDLAYGYGPFVFREIQKLITKEEMTKIIHKMLSDYKTKPIDFKEFQKLFSPYGIDSLLEELLYKTDKQIKLSLPSFHYNSDFPSLNE